MAYTNLMHQHVAVSASTNSELLQGLEAGTIDKTRPYMLTASRQTAGRGQHQRTWHSPKGNIYLSLYHPLTVPLSGLLSLLVGYHLTHLPIIHNLNRLRKRLDLPTVGVKWVNDVGYYDLSQSDNSQKNLKLNHADKLTFNKLAGILIEPVITDYQISGVVIGVGLNVETAPLLSNSSNNDMAYRAMSLHQIIEETLDFQALSLHSNKTTVHRNQISDLEAESNKKLKDEPSTLSHKLRDRDNEGAEKELNGSISYALNPMEGNSLVGSRLVESNAAGSRVDLLPNNEKIVGPQSAALPSVKDLYLPVSRTILRAIEQFISFFNAPHNVQQFINDYSSVNVLKNYKIKIQQSPSLSNSSYLPTESPFSTALLNTHTLHTQDSVLKGFVKGINADGSLKIIEEKNLKNQETTAIYSGTIKVINKQEIKGCET